MSYAAAGALSAGGITAGGLGAFFFAWGTLLTAVTTAQMAGEDERRAESTANAIAAALSDTFLKKGKVPGDDCWAKLKAELKKGYVEDANNVWSIHPTDFATAIIKYIFCVTGEVKDKIPDELFNAILAKMRSRGFKSLLAGVLTGGLAEISKAKGYSKKSAEDLKDWGMVGLPRRDGLAHEETRPPQEGVSSTPDNIWD